MSFDSSDSEFKNTTETIVSIIVVFHNMAREAPRTLYTLTPEYQGLNSNIYEVLVMDNGSTPPLGKDWVESLSDNFRYVYLDNAPESPSFALNKGAALARGSLLGFMIDGARMLSPGILKYAIRGMQAYQHPVIVTLGFHLGKEVQAKAILKGYNQEMEDKLLSSISWKKNGYELFKISCFAESSRNGWFGPISESNCIFIKASDWTETKGFNESFNLPGGGMVNLDFYSRVCTHNLFKPVIVLGEGSFHQFHNGAMTGKTGATKKREYRLLQKQYSDINNKKYRTPSVNYDYIGHLHDLSYPLLKESIKRKDQLIKGPGIKGKIMTIVRNNSPLSVCHNLYRKLF